MKRRGEPLVEGRIQHRGRFAFLLSETEGEPDVYLRGPSLRLAMDGDRVQARVFEERGGRRMGTIVCVVARARTTLVGVLRRAGKFWALVPEDGGEEGAVQVLGAEKDVRLAEGKLAALRIERWPTEERAAGGTVVELIGDPADPKARLSAVLAAREIPTAFPAAALDEAAALPADPSPADWDGRPELFGPAVFTIDGADAKDFDDAVSLEEAGSGRLRLGVHIADVAHYVRADSPLDREGYRRGTSVYLPGRVIPMLPPELSDGLCSLRPDVPRLTMTCWLDLREDGEILGSRIEETVIRSRRRFTYEEVQELLDGREVPRVAADVRDAVLRMGRLAKVLTAARLRRGALDLAAPEYKVVCGPDGEPRAVEKRARLDSHRLIEEFMLAANEAVARTLSKARVPFLRRLHEDPDPERLQQLQEELGRLGIRAKTSLVAHPAEGLQSLLDAARGHPFEETANIQVIRSLKLAVYSPEKGGHFGLASADYCHFTSPIRRYPDLLVHRALKDLLEGRAGARAGGRDLAAAGIRCSERERAAQEAERRAVDLARARLLGREVGKTFEGVVVNATAAGLFVALPESGAVGLLRGGRAALGAKIRVRLAAVDLAAGRLDFEGVRESLPGQVRLGSWRRRRR
ncbi:MAG: VacB/RNase II family 3'-5' exoribonuclease [Elusimicrobia bacterium]|nr:VacB/RNase II family 3'-5' exoribonuclease [Elusimicrobiota bacterium]